MAEIIRKNLNLILLFLILILSLFLRVWRLNSVPPELFGDELDVGYQAYSILKTGKDLQGNFLPIYFQSLAEARAPLYLYSTVPFVAIFGLNEWGVRLTAAFWGILGVLVIYFLTLKLLNNKVIALLPAFFLAISPWHIHYSRAGFEVTLLLFLLILGTYFFLSSFEKTKFLLPSAILFALTPYTYSTGALFMPLFVLSLLILFRENLKFLLKNNSVKLAGLMFVLFLLPFGWSLLFGSAASRFQTISIALNPAIEKNVNEGRRIDNGGAFFHNKPLSFLFETSRNYVWAFSPQFLFVDGDPNMRHSVGQMGEFYWFFLPLFLVGVYTLLKTRDISQPNKNFLIFWLILAPLPASLTYFGQAHATRLFLLLPPLVIISSLGVFELMKNFSKFGVKIFILVLIVIGTVNMTTYFHRYWVHYPIESWRFWQTGYKEAMSYINDHKNEYEKILINNTYEPSLIRFLFYSKYDPEKFHKNFRGDVPQKQIFIGFDGFSLEDKYFFGTKTKDFAQILDSKTLYLTSKRDESPDTPPSGVEILKTIENPFGEPIFYILTAQTENSK